MERLITIQQQLRIVKDKVGDNGRFKFRSAEDIFEKVKPILLETHTAVVVSDTLVEVGGRLAIKAEATLYAADNGSCTAIASANGYALMDKHEIVSKKTGELVSTMSNEQCTGSASSYARKYALCGLFAIDNDELDPDQPEIKKSGTAQQKESSKPSAQPKAEKSAEAPKPANKKEFPDDYYHLINDIDLADNIGAVEASVELSKGLDYENDIRKYASKKGIVLAKTTAEINKAYELIKGREGAQEISRYAIEQAKKKGLYSENG